MSPTPAKTSPRRFLAGAACGLILASITSAATHFFDPWIWYCVHSGPHGTLDLDQFHGLTLIEWLFLVIGLSLLLIPLTTLLVPVN